MQIAVVSAPERGCTDQMLACVAGELLACGVKVAGVVQTNIERAGRDHCDMDLRVLPSGPLIRISQNLGAASQGCRLDAGALEIAVMAVERSLADGADLMIVNKFGKHEAEGRGFRDLIAAALAAGIPVLCGINPRNRSAFDEFAEGIAVATPSDTAQITHWVRGALAEK